MTTLVCTLLFTYDDDKKRYVYDDFVRSTELSISEQKHFIRGLLSQNDNQKRVEQNVTSHMFTIRDKCVHKCVQLSLDGVELPKCIAVDCSLSDGLNLMNIIRIGTFSRENII